MGAACCLEIPGMDVRPRGMLRLGASICRAIDTGLATIGAEALA